MEGAMRIATLLFAVAFVACGGSVLDSEVDPALTNSGNPEVNPIIDLDAPISILGLGPSGTTTSRLANAASSDASSDL
jgi:hypothetical protein